jgi:drug/metabolite transporter (DMT)-like permease
MENGSGLLLGIGFRVLATLAFAIMMTLAQHAIPTTGLALTYFLRGLFAVPVILLFMMLSGCFPGAIATTRWRDHLVRGILAAASLACTFLSISLLPVSLAAALTFLAPLFVTLGAGLFLREKVGPRAWLAIGTSCIGVFIAFQADASAWASSGALLAGVAFGTCGAVLMALSMLQLKRLSRTESAVTLAFYFSVAIAATGAFAVAVDGGSFLKPVSMAAVLAGVFGAIGQLFLAASMRQAPASSLAPFDYMLLVWTLAWDVSVHHRALEMNLLLSPMLIGLAAILMVGSRGKPSPLSSGPLP